MADYQTICTKCFCGYSSVLRRDGDVCGDLSAHPQSACTGKVRRISKYESEQLHKIPGFTRMMQERF